MSPKPVWRADAANTGRLAAAGPATMPSQVFSQKVPGNSAIVTGEQLDPSGNIVVGDAAGDVYSYAPGGGLNWTATFGAGTGSNNKGSALSPTLGRDGALYAGADDGSVNQINPAALAGGKALACPIFTAPLNGGVRPGITTIAQIDGGNHLLVGDDGGTFYSVTPPAPAPTCPSTVNANWSFAATGSTPAAGISAGHPSVAPFSFFAQAALDGQGDLFVASTDGNSQQAGKPQTLGTLYSLNAATGAPNWTVPLQGRVQGAAVYDAAANEVVVADGDGEVLAATATGAGAGHVVWDVHPRPTQGGSAAQFIASLALSPDGQTVYAQDTAYLYALTAATGALSAAFDPSPPVPASGEQNVVGTVADNGSTSSPIVDSAGNIFVETSTGSIKAFSAAGASLWTVAQGVGNGQSGSFAGLSSVSPAIGTDGTLYVSGNKGYLRGFNFLSSAGQTATQIAVLTGTATSTQTSTPSQTDTPGPTDTQTSTPTNTAPPGSTNTNTTTPTGTATASASPTPRLDWSRLRANSGNSGNNHNVSLDLSSAPGQAFATKLSSNGLANTPIVGPDGTIYEPNGLGSLVALNPDGSVKWISDSVLGRSLVAGSSSGIENFDSGSSAAVGPDGYIYVGSETQSIYRFDPATGRLVAHDGSANPFFPNGQYSGSSVTIGPDGAVYAGSTGQDGTFYAVNPDGTRRYAFTPSCKIGSPQFQGTAVLDAQGDTYVGYECVTSGAQRPGGGVVKLSPTGKKLWAYLPPKVADDDTNGSPIYGAAILSPNGKTLYALDTGAARLFALATDTGQPKWTFASPTPLRSVPALSPQGDILYLGAIGYADSPQDLYALSAADGKVLKSVSITDPGAGMTSGVAYAAPAVDGAGQVLFGFVGGQLQGYRAGLGQQLFSELVNNQPGTAIVGGPAIGTSGTIYVTNGKGYLVALRAGVQVPPTVTPHPTSPVPPTNVPQPTNTPVPVLPTDTSTPVPGGACTLKTTAAFSSVTAGEQQLISYTSSSPDARIVSTFFSGMPLYPVHALLLVVQQDGSLSIKPLTGKRVSGTYRYNFSDGPTGHAALSFVVPNGVSRRAVGVSSTAVEACGAAQAFTTFR